MKRDIIVLFFLSLLLPCVSCNKKTTDTSKPSFPPLADSEKNDLLEVYPNLKLDRIKKANEQTLKYADGTTALQVDYVLLDGDVAWCYPIIYYPDGRIEKCFWQPDDYKCDAKEYDPKYKEIMKEAEQMTRDRMKEEGITGLGSVHTFWDYKKKYLKKKGMKWKSPSELNPGVLFD